MHAEKWKEIGERRNRNVSKHLRVHRLLEQSEKKTRDPRKNDILLLVGLFYLTLFVL